MVNIGGWQKLCCTCEFWSGPREPERFGNHVSLPQESVRGRCICQNGPFNRAEKLSNCSTCQYYKKWAALN